MQKESNKKAELPLELPTKEPNNENLFPKKEKPAREDFPADNIQSWDSLKDKDW
ncbi:MAG TPA: hypothetical protein GX723_04015 [Thermoanaerobacterales bacterium]|jgi:hypothetical protein|nr:hypothetical protein [Thermoanaerobacterales bacterium]